MIVISCAIRTRSYVGIEMRIEVSSNIGIANSITTVTKDSLIIIGE